MFSAVRLVVAIQIPTILCLTRVLLYYTSKCMKALKDERRDRISEENRRRAEQTPPRQQVSSILLHETIRWKTNNRLCISRLIIMNFDVCF
jgi:hypothetical protein